MASCGKKLINDPNGNRPPAKIPVPLPPAPSTRRDVMEIFRGLPNDLWPLIVWPFAGVCRETSFFVNRSWYRITIDRMVHDSRQRRINMLYGLRHNRYNRHRSSLVMATPTCPANRIEFHTVLDHEIFLDLGGHCRGIVCLRWKRGFILVNPYAACTVDGFMDFYRNFQEENPNLNGTLSAFGFGFDEIHYEYKIVRIITFTNLSGGLVKQELELYLPTRGRVRQVLRLDLAYKVVCNQICGVAEGSSIFWPCTMPDRSHSILQFNGTTNQLQQFGLPAQRIPPEATLSLGIVPSGLCLCSVIPHSATHRRLDIWFFERNEWVAQTSIISNELRGGGGIIPIGMPLPADHEEGHRILFQLNGMHLLWSVNPPAGGVFGELVKVQRRGLKSPFDLCLCLSTACNPLDTAHETVRSGGEGFEFRDPERGPRWSGPPQQGGRDGGSQGGRGGGPPYQQQGGRGGGYGGRGCGPTQNNPYYGGSGECQVRGRGRPPQHVGRGGYGGGRSGGREGGPPYRGPSRTPFSELYQENPPPYQAGLSPLPQLGEASSSPSVSIVPPAYYAHLAAFRARFYMEPETSDSGSMTSGTQDFGRRGPGGGRFTRGPGANAMVRPLPALKENVKKKPRTAKKKPV